MENTERQPIVGKKQIDEAYARLQKYKMGKKALETRIVTQRSGGKTTIGRGSEVKAGMEMIQLRKAHGFSTV